MIHSDAWIFKFGRLNFQGNLEEAYSVYEQAIAIERGKEHSRALPLLYAQYSRFLNLVCLLKLWSLCLEIVHIIKHSAFVLS